MLGNTIRFKIAVHSAKGCSTTTSMAFTYIKQKVTPLASHITKSNTILVSKTEFFNFRRPVAVDDASGKAIPSCDMESNIEMLKPPQTPVAAGSFKKPDASTAAIYYITIHLSFILPLTIICKSIVIPYIQPGCLIVELVQTVKILDPKLLYAIVIQV